MIGLIKLILGLLILTGLVVYGGDIWDKTKEKISEYTNPELQRASVYESLKNNFGQIESIINELNQNESKLEPEQKAKLEEAAKLAEESKNNIEEAQKNNSTLIEKAFENANDLKEGIQNLFSNQSGNSQTPGITQNCQ